MSFKEFLTEATVPKEVITSFKKAKSLVRKMAIKPKDHLNFYEGPDMSYYKFSAQTNQSGMRRTEGDDGEYQIFQQCDKAWMTEFAKKIGVKETEYVKHDEIKGMSSLKGTIKGGFDVTIQVGYGTHKNKEDAMGNIKIVWRLKGNTGIANDQFRAPI